MRAGSHYAGGPARHVPTAVPCSDQVGNFEPATFDLFGLDEAANFGADQDQTLGPQQAPTNADELARANEIRVAATRCADRDLGQQCETKQVSERTTTFSLQVQIKRI